MRLIREQGSLLQGALAPIPTYVGACLAGEHREQGSLLQGALAPAGVGGDSITGIPRGGLIAYTLHPFKLSVPSISHVWIR